MFLNILLKNFCELSQIVYSFYTCFSTINHQIYKGKLSHLILFLLIFLSMLNSWNLVVGWYYLLHIVTNKIHTPMYLDRKIIMFTCFELYYKKTHMARKRTIIFQWPSYLMNLSLFNRKLEHYWRDTMNL